MDKDNKLIAKFMELTIRPKINGYSFIELNDMEVIHENDLEYHESWDWLMPVIEKIEEFRFSYKINGLHGKIHYCWFNKLDEEGHSELKTQLGYNGKMNESLLIVVYKAIIEFIKWYNKQ